MEFTNKCFINTKDWNKSTDKFVTKQMSFYNGKSEDGKFKNGYETVVAFGNDMKVLESIADTNQLVTIKGDYRVNEKDGKRYPQFIFRSIVEEDDNPFEGAEKIDDFGLPF